MTESQIVTACLEWLAAKGIMAWRTNNTGIYDPSKGCFRSFRGRRGVSDILGIVPQQCPCALQGVFLAVEVKTPKKSPTPDQEGFLQQIRERGGIGICVHSIDELATEMADVL